ncbi:hypothetical protein BDY19DRAFT_953707 [Irpex rosettiformis]|uniref:Uncharacterized protein n=1 Tax=Irpex rosettiformis TaxID=378272 RepID=A0ACB8U0L4_9APHY|nr:hypothetical protein BDY19DRAFT_953707 [Irpex rosettiformis]
MIQIDNSEKANLPPPVTLAPPPPSYSQVSPPARTGALNSPVPTPTSGVPLYPAQTPLVSPIATGQGAAGPSRVQTVSPGIQQQPRAMMPMNLEAQIGSQYQQELFARCARGDHVVDTKYGPCGIITAVICFPIGLIALFVDREKKCSRCGVKIL